MEKKPFFFFFYTQEDWDILNGKYFDAEVCDEYVTPMAVAEYIAVATKPKWA